MGIAIHIHTFLLLFLFLFLFLVPCVNGAALQSVVLRQGTPDNSTLNTNATNETPTGVNDTSTGDNSVDGNMVPGDGNKAGVGEADFNGDGDFTGDGVPGDGAPVDGFPGDGPPGDGAPGDGFLGDGPPGEGEPLVPPEKPKTFNGDCKGFDEVLLRAEGDASVAWIALFVLCYFLGLSSLVFGIIAMIRIHALSARGRPVKTATVVFGLLLTFSGTLAMILRSLLGTIDLRMFGITNVEMESAAVEYCEFQLGDEWIGPVGNPYLGQPPRNTWVFWLFITFCFGGAAALALSLIRIRLEERAPSQSKIQMQLQDDNPTEVA